MTDPVILSGEALAGIEARLHLLTTQGYEPMRSTCSEYTCNCHDDIPALCQTVRALRDNPRRVWDEHPNRDGSGKKCTECGFDNRFHVYECFFYSPSLKISEEAFNTLHDEKVAAEKENTALCEQLAQREQEREQLTEQVAEHGSKCMELAEEIRGLESRLAQVQKERDDARDEVKELQGIRDQLEARL